MDNTHDNKLHIARGYRSSDHGLFSVSTSCALILSLPGAGTNTNLVTFSSVYFCIYHYLLCSCAMHISVGTPFNAARQMYIYIGE